jgi:hypothetical protein
MCDCQDVNNVNSIPSGPAGPQGPAGPAGATGPTPVLDGVSLSNVSVALAPIDFTLTGATNLAVGQRVSVISADLTKTMAGTITAYNTGTKVLTVNVDTITGAGSAANWNISLAGVNGPTGPIGPTGPTGSNGTNGVNAYTTATVGINSGVNLYTLTVANSTWMTTGQMIYVQGAGYYSVSSKPASDSVIILDNGTTGNIPGNLIFGGTTKTVSPAGATGANGTNGVNGFNYETVDGNNIPAQGASEYMFLMRNSTNTGYTFTSLSDLKALLALIP